MENLDPTMRIFLRTPIKNNDTLVYFQSMCKRYDPTPAIRVCFQAVRETFANIQALNRYAVGNCKVNTINAADAILIDRCFEEIEQRIENSAVGSHFMDNIKEGKDCTLQ